MEDFLKEFPHLETDDTIIEKNLTIDKLSALIDRFTGGKTEEKTEPFEPFTMKNNEYFHYYRFEYSKIFGWSIPSVSALEKIKEFVGTDTVLEIAAGRGFWSALLKSIGMNVIATSIADGHYYSAADMEKTWLDIELLDCVEAVNKYSDANCLFISWGNGQLYKSLREFKGNKLIVIGEGLDGCTDALDENDNEFGFELKEFVEIPVWWGIHDVVHIFTRKIE